MTLILPSRRAAWLAATVFLLGLFRLFGETTPALADDTGDFLGPNACGGCHTNIAVSWAGTRHAKSLKTLQGHPAARRMTRDLSLNDPTRAKICVDCHVTAIGADVVRQPTAGVSCESCHGAASAWLQIHAGDRSSETPTNEMQPSSPDARAQAVANGMITGSPLLKWARGCFDCHVVQREQLVGLAGHSAGSNFELVAWSEGEVRHHLAGQDIDQENALRNRRLKFVLGAGLDLEYALRGVAAARSKGPYAVKMAVRVRLAEARLRRIARAEVLEEVDSMLAVVDVTRLELDLTQEIEDSANQIAALVERIARTRDGRRLGPIDVLLPPPSEYVFSRR